MDALATVLVPSLFIPVFALFWAGVVWLIGRVGGWQKLAEAYPEAGVYEGERFYMQRARFGLSNYKGVLTLTVSETGVRFSVFPLFRPGHPAFFVPWSDVSASEHTGWLVGHVAVTLARAPEVRIHLFGTGGAAVLRRATGNLFG